MGHLTVEVVDHIATVTLDRPPVNAVDRATLAEIGEVFSHLGDDRDVRAAIFTGAGPKAFMAGADLRSMGDEDRDAWPAAWVTDQGVVAREALWAVYDCAVPVIAAVNGAAIGAGLAFAAMCDMILAADTARFGTTEINVGLLGASAHLSRLAGAHKVREMYLTGELVDAAEMHRFGAVKEVLPLDELLPRARELAAVLAAKSPIAMRLAKEALNRVEFLPLKEAYRVEQEYTRRLATFEDAEEARQAFLEQARSRVALALAGMATSRAHGPDAPPRPVWTTRRRFLGVLLLITVAAAGIRVTYVLGVTRHQEQLYGDQIAYARVAETLADGRGFRDPFILDRTLPNADHPPLTSILVTPAYLLLDRRDGADTAARLIMAMVGAGTVFAVGLAARRVAANVEVDPDSPRARRVGWIAAGVAAVLPGLWIHDGLIMSEGIGALTIALVIWAAVRALDRPNAWRFAALGAAVGLSALARSESLILAAILVVPLVFTRRGERAERGRFAPLLWLVAAGLGASAVLAPWVVPNMVRFENPVFLSTNDGSTLLGSNCDAAYHGPTKGLWILDCVLAESDPDAADASVNSATFRTAGLRYIRDHLGDVPGVVVVRELRAWSLWSPRQEVYLNSGEGDETWVSWAAIVGSWAMMAAGVAGMVVLRRRDRPVWPLAVQAVAVTIAAALFYGLARFRIGADVAFVVAAAVAFEAVLARRRASA